MYLQRGVSSMPISFSTAVMPGDLVGDRRDVVHAIDDGDVLVEVEVLAELLEAGMQIADVGHRLDDGFAVQGEDEAQGGMRGRVLRTEVEGPEVVLGPRRSASVVWQRVRGAWTYSMLPPGLAGTSPLGLAAA